MRTYSSRKYALLLSRELRKNQTIAEELLWERIRKRKVLGYRFNRQYPIYFDYKGKERFFIADFFCYELDLIIEIDGEVHERQKDYDKMREELLESMSYNILRFRNDEIFEDISEVINKIKKFIEE